MRAPRTHTVRPGSPHPRRPWTRNANPSGRSGRRCTAGSIHRTSPSSKPALLILTLLRPFERFHPSTNALRPAVPWLQGNASTFAGGIRVASRRGADHQDEPALTLGCAGPAIVAGRGGP